MNGIPVIVTITEPMPDGGVTETQTEEFATHGWPAYTQLKKPGTRSFTFQNGPQTVRIAVDHRPERQQLPEGVVSE